MSANVPENDLLKIVVPLKGPEREECGYASELLWVKIVGPRIGVVDSVPLFTVRINYGDTIAIEDSSGVDVRPHFQSVLEPSGVARYRFLSERQPREEEDGLLDVLRKLIGPVARDERTGVIGVIAPDDAREALLLRILEDGEAEGKLSFERVVGP